MRTMATTTKKSEESIHRFFARGTREHLRVRPWSLQRAFAFMAHIGEIMVLAWVISF